MNPLLASNSLIHRPVHACPIKPRAQQTCGERAAATLLPKAIFNSMMCSSVERDKLWMIDIGSAGRKAIFVSFDAQGHVSILKRIDAPKSDKSAIDQDQDFITSIFAESQSNGQVIMVDVGATAWARPSNSQDSKSREVKESSSLRRDALQALVESYPNGFFEVVSQKEEGRRAQAALRKVLEQDPAFLGYLNIEDCEAVDGGKGSVQGGAFSQEEEFGGLFLEDWFRNVADVSVEHAWEYCVAKFNKDIPSSDKSKTPFFCGIHLHALKNSRVIKFLKLGENDLEAWTMGRSHISAENLQSAIQAAAQEVHLEFREKRETNKKEANDKLLNELSLLLIAGSVVAVYRSKRGAKIVRWGEYKNVKGEDMKVNYYLGGTIEHHEEMMKCHPARPLARKVLRCMLSVVQMNCAQLNWFSSSSYSQKPLYQIKADKDA